MSVDILQRKNKKKAWDKTSRCAMVRIAAVGSCAAQKGRMSRLKCGANNDEQVAMNAWVEWGKEEEIHD
jgi:hypothetical protein